MATDIQFLEEMWASSQLPGNKFLNTFSTLFITFFLRVDSCPCYGADRIEEHEIF